MMSERLAELLRMRAFLDCEIKIEQLRVDVGGDHSPIALAADLYSITVADLLSDRQDQQVVDARHVAAWLLRQAGASYPAIGRILARDHSTMIHAVRRVESRPAMRALAVGLLGSVDKPLRESHRRTA